MLPSTFDVFGPIMVGPSSSHTAGALRIAQVAADVAPKPIKSVEFVLYNSFSATYRGHGTDKALVAGILGMKSFDPKVPDSFEYAKQKGLKYSFVAAGTDIALHPNTVDINMDFGDDYPISVRGESRGGGKVRIVGINGQEIKIRGEHPALIVHHKDSKGALATMTGLFAKADINIASLRSSRDDVSSNTYTIIESDQKITQGIVDTMRALDYVHWAERVAVPGETTASSIDAVKTEFGTVAELLELCHAENTDIATLMKRREIELAGSAEEVDQQMEHVRRVMEHSITATIEKPERSLGGYLDGQARAVDKANFAQSDELLGERLTKAVSYAMAVLELSACMGVIVAAPTAGSAGVVPGALYAFTREPALIERGLYTAAAIGAIIMNNASVSGAEGGCQAEVGSAAAMTAAALCAMQGASPDVCCQAATISIGNLLGLVCDPVKGLVEYPCQNRNAIGVASAYSAAQLALSGVTNPVTLDEAIAAQASVGHLMPESLRETAKGGLAICPSVCGGCAQPCA